MKALIVEDDETARKVLQAFLKPYAECELASGGIEAISKFKTALSQGSPYELVCLDIMMPGMDGHQVLKNIRSTEQEFNRTAESRAKIIVITALDDSSNVFSAFVAGCEGYIVKPIDKVNLISQLEKLGLVTK